MYINSTHRALGAQLLQSLCRTEESPFVALFYLTPTPSPTTPTRGGVPILFPQFADTGPLPKHGLVRNVLWQPEGDSAYTLHIAATDYPAWPHACALRVAFHAVPDGLRIVFTVTNTGTSAFTWTGGLHPYFAVADLQASRLEGLAGVGVRDRYDATVTHQTADALTWTDQVCERLYASAPPLLLCDGVRTLCLRTGGFDQWMVWNPGVAGAKALADLPDGDWMRFVVSAP